jgi:capsular polysaccharide export protein
VVCVVNQILQPLRYESDREPVANTLSVAEIAVALSPGILGIKNLASMLGLKQVLSPRAARKLALPADVILAWGRKDTADVAIEYASRRSLPVWFLEDGWIRTASERAHSRRCYSILLDEDGVYYDSTKPSKIENYLNKTDEQLAVSCDSEALSYTTSVQPGFPPLQSR